MKKLIVALATLFVFVASVTAQSNATDRTTTYTGQNPASVTVNLDKRNLRIGEGTHWWNEYGSNASDPGRYANCKVVPVTGLFVAVSPVGSVSDCSVEQLGPDDALGYGGFPAETGTFLPADPTQIELQGLLAAGTSTASIGPLAVGASSGQSVASLIECQVTTFDTTSIPINIVSSTGIVTSTTANRDRVDRLSCQSKAGTSSASPVIPTVDSGWVSIAAVTVPFATTTINSGMITAQTGQLFYGLAQASPLGANAVILSPSSQQTGNINVSGTITGVGGLASQFISVLNTTATANMLTDGTNLLFRGYTSGSTTNFESNAGTPNVTFPDAGGIGVLRGNVTTAAGFIGASFNTTFSSPGGTVNGDLVGQRSTTTGLMWLGGAGGSGSMDWSLNNPTEFSFFRTGASYAQLNGAAFNITSDRRWKKDIKDIPYGLDQVMRLDPRAFTWKADNRKDLGFIAQEVMRIFPQLVHQDKHGYYLLNYIGIIPVLTHAIQQQQHEIKKDHDAIAALQTQLDYLYAMIVILMFGMAITLVRSLRKRD